MAGGGVFIEEWTDGKWDEMGGDGLEDWNTDKDGEFSWANCLIIHYYQLLSNYTYQLNSGKTTAYYSMFENSRTWAFVK